MIRTHIVPCSLPKAVADALNRASGTVYTRTLVTHYRVYVSLAIARATGSRNSLACD